MAPVVQKTPKITETRFRLEGVEDDKDSNGSDADLPLRDEGAEAVSDEDPLQLEENCDELGDHPPDGEKDAGALLGGLDEAWDEHSLKASDDEASVDDAIDVALNDMDGAAPSPDGDPTHMDVPTQMPAEMAVAQLEEPVGSQGLPSAVTVVLAEGTITWYQYSADFVAKYTHRRQKHRTGNAGQVPERGRPLGGLTAWLLSSPLYPTGQEHKAPTACHLTPEERIGAREFLKTVGGDAAHLLALERSKREDEGSEPVHRP